MTFTYLAGYKVVIVPDYTALIPKRLPKRKHWRLKKKFIKRYGYKTVPAPSIPDGKILAPNTTIKPMKERGLYNPNDPAGLKDLFEFHSEPTLYMNKRTYDIVSAKMREYEQGKKDGRGDIQRPWNL